MGSQFVICVVACDDFIATSLASAGYQVEIFPSIQRLLSRTGARTPACILLDLRNQHWDRDDLNKLLNQTKWNSPLFFISAQNGLALGLNALQMARDASPEDPINSENVIDCLAAAIGKNDHSCQQCTELTRRMSQLTPRELEVMRLVSVGLLNKQIASHLNISCRTVEIHRRRIMEKLDVNNLADLVALAVETGLRNSAYESRNRDSRKRRRAKRTRR